MSIWGDFVNLARQGVGSLTEEWSFLRSFYLCRRKPIIEYQMGKVGSRSTADSLKEFGLDSVFHVHRMNPDNIGKVRKEYLDHHLWPPNERIGRRLYRHVVARGRKAKFITLVREAVGRNMSAFYNSFRRFTGVEYDKAAFETEELTQIFLRKYNHSVPLTWFDLEMKQTLGIDVYEHPFPQERGYLTIRKGNFELLVLKLEIDDFSKEQAIGEFLNIDNFKLLKKNVGETRNYGESYRRFIQNVRLPLSYVEEMCHSKYMRHFYGADEINRFRDRWLRTVS